MSVYIMRQAGLWMELEGGGGGGGAAGLLGPGLARRCRQAFEAAAPTGSKLQVHTHTYCRYYMHACMHACYGCECFGYDGKARRGQASVARVLAGMGAVFEEEAIEPRTGYR